jgi:hypothetical protein
MNAADSILKLAIDNAVVFSGAVPTDAANETNKALLLHIQILGCFDQL